MTKARWPGIKTEMASTPFAHITIMRVDGRMTIGWPEPVNRAIEEQKPGTDLLLDLTHYQYFDTKILGSLVGGYKKITSEGGKMKVLQDPSWVSDRHEVGIAHGMFEIYYDREIAFSLLFPTT